MSLNDWDKTSDRLNSAIVLDALDQCGYVNQSPRLQTPARTVQRTMVGIAKTTLWMDFAHEDPDTYAKELEAIDSLNPGEVIVCATSNSARSGIWGELLTTAAKTKGANGVYTDGAVRDTRAMIDMDFPVYSQFVSAYDSYNRQKVVAYDTEVEIGGVRVSSGDIIVVDGDGAAIVPKAVADEVLERILVKLGQEDQFREAVKQGMPLTTAYEKYKVL